MSTYAALGLTGMVWGPTKDTRRRYIPEWPTLRVNAGWLLGLMDKYEITRLHIHASALGVLGLPAALEPPQPGQRRPPHEWLDTTWRGYRPSSKALAPFIQCGDLELQIGAYQDGAGDPFAGARDALELLEALQAFERAVELNGKPWAYRHSAILTGWQLMHQAAKGKRTAGLEAFSDTRQPELTGLDPGQQVEKPYGGRWTRAKDHSAGLPYVHAWDINGQRLAACSRLPLGVGGLTHARATNGVKLNVKRDLPGYHLVTEVENPHEGAIPPIFEPGWHTTPRVNMAIYLGIPLTITESWTWSEHRPYLNGFYDVMSKARTELIDAAATPDGAPARLALNALKQAYLQPLGRLRSEQTRRTNSIYYRPHWYDSVIGAELARQYLRMHQLAEIKAPVMAVYFDTIIIESDRPQPDDDATLGVLEVSTQLGKYKPVGTLPADQARTILYDGPRGTNVGALVKALKNHHGGENAAGVTAPNTPAASARPPQPGDISSELLELAGELMLLAGELMTLDSDERQER